MGRGYSAETNRGAAAAGTWIFRGDESRRRRGWDVDIPRSARLRYSDHVKGKISETFTNRAKGLKAAFELLSDHVADDGEHQISRESFEKLVAETNKVEKVPRVVADEVDFFFSIMDDDSSGAISKKEFYDVCNILQYAFRRPGARGIAATPWA